MIHETDMQRLSDRESLLAQLDMRRDRMLKHAARTALLPLAIALMAFSAWDFWLDPVHAPVTLLIRIFAASCIVIAALWWVPRCREPQVKYIYAAVLLLTSLAITSGLLFLDDGFAYGTPGVTVFPLLLAYYSIPRRLYWALCLTGLCAALAAAFWRAVEPDLIINLIIFYALCTWGGYTAARVMKSQQLRVLALERQFAEEARTDVLTGLANRRMLFERGPSMLALAEREHVGLTIAVLDLDHFKEINDRFGHELGDRVLRSVAQALRKVLRTSDFLARSGGEEFVAVLFNCTGNDAKASARRMLEAGRDLSLPELAGFRSCTLSIGLACFPEHGQDWPILLKRADAALYEAQRAGRARWAMANG